MRRKSFIISILIIPFMILGLGALTSTGDTTWKVALYAKEDGLAQNVCERLIDNQQFIQFYQCASKEELEQDIVTKKAECGVYFGEGFEQAVSDMQFDEQVILYHSPSGIVQKMVREEVFAATIAEANETILFHFMEQQTGTESLDKERLLRAYEKYMKDGNVFHFEYKEIPAYGKRGEGYQIILSPVRGMLAVFIWAETLLGVLLLYADDKNGIYKSMPKDRKIFCRISILGIPSIFSALFSLFILFCSKILYETRLLSLGRESTFMILYCILCILSGLCLYYICKNPVIYILLVTVFLITGVVLCPVFFSLHDILPQVDIIQNIMLPGSYLCVFLTGNKGFLLGEIGILLAFCVIHHLKGIILE